MEDEQPQNVAEPQQQQQRPGKVQLGEFWPQAPNAWFAAADLKFEVAHITSQRDRFAHAVGASKASGGKHICWKHAKFGKKAYFCADEDNCSWLGN